MNQAGAPIGEVPFTRTGLLGFVGPVRKAQIVVCLREKVVGTKSKFV